MPVPLARAAAAALWVAAAAALLLALPAAASAASERLLAIETAGDGIGEVECKEASGPAEACEAEYPEGTKLTLVPVAEEGSSFAGFSSGIGSAAGCAGTGVCTFTIAVDSGITATFEAVAEYSFEINYAGEGEGEVECTVAGETEQFCDGEYPAGTRLTLESPSEAKGTIFEGSTFAGFSAGTGSASGCTGKTCSFKLEADSSIVATFEYKEYALTVIKQGSGSGTVECEAEEGPEVCKSKYIWGMEVVLRAKAAAGSEFTGWTGLSGCEKVFGPGGTECDVEMYKAHTVRANFALAGSGEEEGEEEPPPAEEEGEEEEEPPPGEEGEEQPSPGEEAAGSEEQPGGGGNGSGEEKPAGGGSAQSAVSSSPAPPATVSPPRGAATVARIATVRGSMAALRLRCVGAGACAGTLEVKAKLSARAAPGGRRRRAASFVRIGGARFALSAGGSATLRLRVRRAAARSLARRGTLRVTVTGTGVTPSTIVLKAAKTMVKHR